MNKRTRLSRKDRKKQICDAARNLFVEKGFENTTMKDIMEKTGISIGGLYYYYENIYDVLKDVIMSVENRKNEMFFGLKDRNPSVDIGDIIIHACIEMLFDSSEYSALYVHLLLGMKDNAGLEQLYMNRKKKAKQEYLSLLESINAVEYYVLSNDDFIDFFNYIKIGNYYLAGEHTLDSRKIMYTQFIKSYIDNNILI